tara:strand:+ start:10126 stop:10836 length:711 start_codon:yes stop_codon:yes gene_type:complete
MVDAPSIVRELWFLPILFSVVVSVIYYLSNKFKIRNKDAKLRIISFSAGVSITYLLLEFFPRFTEGALGVHRMLFLAVLFGFTVHHIIEKEIYLHHSKHGLIKMLSLEENVFSYIYHIVVGGVFVYLSRSSVIEGFLYFITIMSYTFVSTLPTKPHESKFKSIILSSSTVVGAVLMTIFFDFVAEWTHLLLMGFAIGVLIFTVTRHHIPFGRHGRSDYFTLGLILYAALIMASWFV